MGKSKKKDRMYVSAKEHSIYNYGGKGFKPGEKKQFHRLPFSSCAISLQPFTDPVALRIDSSAVLFDILNVVPFIRKYKKNPLTGEKCSVKELIKVKFSRNADGVYPLLPD
tara:strand:- start:13 stop:345 length:333 start_codon:yes stop_codon:yes gene_type:complete